MINYLFPRGLKSRLSLKLVFYVVLCSLFFTFLASAFQLTIQYNRYVSDIQRNFAFIKKNYLPFVAQSVYVVDEAQLRLQLKGLLNLPDIEYLEIVDESTDFSIAEGVLKSDRSISKVLPLTYQSADGVDVKLGEFRITAGFDDIYQRLKGSAWVIFTTSMIQIFPTAFVILLIIQYIFTRHLTNMAKYAEELNINTLDTTLDLKRKRTRWAKTDELDQVVMAFNDLQYRLKKDIDERVKAQMALRENEQLLNKEKKFLDDLINSLPVIIFLFEESSQLVRWNRSFQAKLGFSKEELLGKTPYEFFEKDDVDVIKRGIEQTISKVPLPSDESYDIRSTETLVLNKDGSTTPYLLTAAMIEKDGKQHLAGAGVDISALKRAEKELHITQYSIDNSSTAALRISQDGFIKYANNRVNQFTGYDNEQLYNMYIWDIMPLFPRNEFEGYWQYIKETQTNIYEGALTTIDGVEVPVEVTANFQEFAGEEFIYVYVQDISERKKSEIERARLVSVIEQSNDNVVITDTQGNIEYVNPAFERNTGYTLQEVYQKNPKILSSGKHDKEFYHQLWSTITSGRVWTGNLQNRKKDGKIIHEFATIFPIVNSRGDIANFAAVKRDVTELKLIEDQLRQTQKMEAIGTLAGGIAHDFNNILSAIYAYTHLSKRKLQDIPETQKIDDHLEKLLSAADRAKDLVDQILTFSRKVEYEMQVLDLEPMIKESIKFLTASIPATINIQYHLDKDLKHVKGDYTQLYQVVINLCTNAFHAMEANGGDLEVSLTNYTLHYQAPDTGNLPPGEYVMLSVKDNGPGMSPDIVERVFDPFFTTKLKGKGTGLGLSVVLGIIEKHGGAIKVFSQEGQGTKMVVWLPVSEAKAKVRQEPEKIYPKGSETILLVDDEDDIVAAYGDILRLHGYEVKARTNSKDALKECEENDFDFDLLITDYTMPGINGMQFSKELRKFRPNTPIIMISGLVEGISRKEMEEIGIKKLLSKPIKTETILSSVREILDA